MAEILARLERPDLAKEYLKKVLDAKLDEAALVKLADRFGPAAVSRMATQASCRRGAPSWPTPSSSAVKQHARVARTSLADTGQAASLGRRRRLATGRSRRLARRAPAAVAPLVAVLADPARSGEHARARDVLAGLGGNAAGAAVGLSGFARSAVRGQGDRRAGQERRARGVRWHLLMPYVSPESDPAVRTAAGRGSARNRWEACPAERKRPAFSRGKRSSISTAKSRSAQDEKGQATVWQWDAKSRQGGGKDLPGRGGSGRDGRAIGAGRLGHLSGC